MSTAVDGGTRNAGARTETARREAAGEFVRRVMALDRGELATLKRNAGNTLGEARGVPWFFRLLHVEEEWRNPEICFLVATLIGLNKYTGEGNLGASARRLAHHPNSSPESVDRRFRILLDSDREQLAYRLRQMVKLMASREVGVDWAQLLMDLRQWHWSGKPPRKWAEKFYRPLREAPDAGEEAAVEIGG